MYNTFKYNSTKYNSVVFIFEVVGKVITEKIPTKTKKRIYRFARYFDINGKTKNNYNHVFVFGGSIRSSIEFEFLVQSLLKDLFEINFIFVANKQMVYGSTDILLFADIRNKYLSNFNIFGSYRKSVSISNFVLADLRRDLVLQQYFAGKKQFEYFEQSNLCGLKRDSFVKNCRVDGKRDINKILSAVGIV